MRHPGRIWVVFGLCVTFALGAMAWVHHTAVRLERAEAQTRRQAEREEALQVALWRIDSTLAPLIAEEGSRPYFHYSPFYPAERAYTPLLCEIRRGDVMVPSPLLTHGSRRIRLHFQFAPDGHLSSPQVPDGEMCKLARSCCIRPDRAAESARRLEELRCLVRRSELAVGLEECIQPFACPSGEPMLVAESIASPGADPSARTGRVSQGPLRAVWVGPALLLARSVRTEEGTYLQGCWLDWDALRSELLNGVADLLPRPDLEPVLVPDGPEPTHLLAAVPARLVPGPTPGAGMRPWSPLTASLWAGWVALTLSALAAALLLRGAVALSERRGTFVSAVTHELRTPLTTFRLYTEMLAEGMVRDEDARRSYLRTLRAEADRLGHLVENVLTFARLERGRGAGRMEVVTSNELLERLGPSLSERARQSGMDLLVSGVAPPAWLRTDVSSVGQVLSNLVDNACKYAGSSPDHRIHLDASAADGRLTLTVRDHGPGISRRAARRLFRPFSKSARDAARSAPGVGLGLALSRRISRALGGDLRHQPSSPDGACFALTLPLGV
jgi:signal transduction histidine kinase